MLLPARSPTPQVLPEPQGVSVNFLSKEGVLSSSNILRVWNNQLKEIWAPRKACKSRLQRVLPSERSGPRGHTSQQQIQLPSRWRAQPGGVTQARPGFKGSTPGRSRAKTQALGRSGSASVACTQQAFRGHLGHIQGQRGKGHLGPSRRGRTLHGVRQAVKKRINSLHCTHIVNTLTWLFQTRHRHNSSRLPPASNEAVPRLRCSAQAERQTRPQNEDPC